MKDWLTSPMQIDRGNFLATFGALIVAVIALPLVVRARDDRRIRAMAFAQRVKEAADPSASAGA